MHSITPLDQVSRETVEHMAEAAADNGEPPSANPFEVGHPMHDRWLRRFHERDIELNAVTCT